jgi:hypothetical protein
VIRRVAWLLGFVVLIATAIYTIVYLYRWEWNRALFVLVLFVAVEVAMSVVLLLHRLREVDETVRAGGGNRPALARIEQARPERHHFAWLERSASDLSVFVTVLLGAGVILSLGTWIVERIATRTSLPTLERGLARRLDAVAFPADPLVPDDASLVAEGGPYGEDHFDVLLGPQP